MRYTCFVREDPQSQKCYEELSAHLNQAGWIKDDTDPQLVITIGGDGTVLSAIHQYINNLTTCTFTGINTGSLGFFSDYKITEMDLFKRDLLGKQPTFTAKRMIQAKIDDDEAQVFYALNEIRVESHIKTTIIQIDIDNYPLELICGNGLCISSQAGSTAYNRSLGGAILDEDLNGGVGLQLTEILPVHNSSFRSLKSSFVLAENRKITIYDKSLGGNFSNSVLCYDNLYTDLQGKSKISINLGDIVVKFSHYKNIAYLERIKTLF